MCPLGNYYFCYILFSITVINGKENFNPSPIIAAPGLFNVFLRAAISQNTSSAVECASNRGQHLSVWSDLSGGLLKILTNECVRRLLRLSPDPIQHAVYRNQAATFYVEGFGNIDKLPTLKLIAKTAQELGYVKGYNLRAAYFDFRMGYDDPVFLHQYEDLIERTYNETGGLPVTLFCYSLSCLNTLYFLQQRSAEWKAKYVQEYIMLGAPLGGAFGTLSLLISGDILGIFNWAPIKAIVNVARYWTSVYNLLPNGRSWNHAPVLITGNRNFTVDDYEELFQLLNDTVALDFYRATKRSNWDPYKPPGVTTHCFWGTKLPTGGVQKLNQELGTFKGMPSSRNFKIFNEDGDGVVTERSASICKHWGTHPKQNGKLVFEYPMEKFGHSDLAGNIKMVPYWQKILRTQ